MYRSLNKDVGVLIEHGSPSFAEGFSLDSGDSLWRHNINLKYKVKDGIVREGKCYILTDSMLYVIASKGESIANIRFSKQFRPANLILQDSIIFIVGERKIGAWKLSSDDSIQLLWEKKTGNLRRLSSAKKNYVWFCDDNDSLMVINKWTGQTVRSVYLPYDEVLGKPIYDERLTKANYLLLKSWKDLGIIRLDSLLEGLPDL